MKQRKGVSTYAKILIWKQFTTRSKQVSSTTSVFLPMQKY